MYIRLLLFFLISDPYLTIDFNSTLQLVLKWYVQRSPVHKPYKTLKSYVV